LQSGADTLFSVSLNTSSYVFDFVIISAQAVTIYVFIASLQNNKKLNAI